MDAQENSESPITRAVDHAFLNAGFIIKVAEDLGRELYQKCTPEEQNYYDAFIKIPDEDSAQQICQKTVGQDNGDWDEARFGRITGSISYPLYTYYKNKHSDSDWEYKLIGTYDSSFRGNDDTDRGLESEIKAKVCYEEAKGNVKVENVGILINPAVPWLGYSADGIVHVSGKIGRLWEVKTPVKGATNGASTICEVLPYMKKENKLKEKHRYYGQVQLGMLLWSLPFCDFTVYCYKPNQVYIDPVPFNEKFCLEFVKILTKVYFERVLPWLVSQKNDS